MIKITFQEAESYIIQSTADILQKKGKCIIAIDGNSAAGKSTLGQKLAINMDASLFHMDDFFLPPQKRSQERLATPGGNVDSERFYEEIIKGILSDKDFTYNVFSCCNGKFHSQNAHCKSISIIEGVYSLHPLWRKHIDLSIFMSIDKAVQRERILLRNGPEKLNDFVNKWIPMENMYFDAFGVQDNVDVIIT